MSLNRGDGGAEKCGNNAGAIVITKPRDQPKSRPWKGKGRRKIFDPKFLIKEDAIIDPGFRDTRTTVMVKNIPNKYRSCY